MADKPSRSLNKSLLHELLFYGIDLVRDSCASDLLPTNKDLGSIYDLDLFSLNTKININPPFYSNWQQLLFTT